MIDTREEQIRLLARQLHMSTYVLYLRKSREDEEAELHGAGDTLLRHRKILSDLAARNGHTIAAEYREIVSGELISMRPQMQMLLHEVNAGHITGVYVTEISRLARGDNVDQGIISEAFLSSGTLIITPHKTYDPKNEMDEEFLETQLFFSRREYKSINRRIQAGRRQSLKEGKYICSIPAYGYRKIKSQDGRGYTLAIDESEANVVRNIFQWYVYGCNGKPMGYTAIGTRLASMGTPTGTGKNWRPSRIQRILINPVYAGIIQFGKNKTVRSVGSGGIVKSRQMSDENAVQYAGLHPSIISADLFKKAQLVGKARGKTVPMRHDMAMSNPLSGLIVCASCGHIMSRLPPVDRYAARVKCSTHACPTVSAPYEAVEASVLSILRSWMDDLDAGIDPYASMDYLQPFDNSAQILVQNLSNQLNETESRISKLFELVETGAYSTELFKSRFDALTEQKKALTTDLAKAREDAATAAHPIPNAVLQSRLHSLFDALAQSITPQEQNDLFRTIIQKITYSKTVHGWGRGQSAAKAVTQFTITVYPALEH